MRLKIGTQMRIERLSITQCGRQVVQLIGYVDKRCLFVTAPADLENPSNTIPYLEGDHVTLRVFSGQNAFGFASRVERVLTSPFHYLHLSFPVQIVAKKVRAAPRVRTRITASLTAAENAPVDVLLTNLSRAGAELTTTVPVGKPGDAMQLAFTLNLDEGPMPLSVNAAIRSCAKRTRSDATEYSYGVQFLDLGAGDAIQVSHFINQELAERPELAI